MASQVVAALTALYTASAQMPYGAAGKDLPVDPLAGQAGVVGFLAHALQCAAQAAQAFPADVELRVAALLHDVGWLLAKPTTAELLTSSGGGQGQGGAAASDALARHDVTGAAYLASLGFPPRVCRLVGAHVGAKRYLVATEPRYAATLSEGSVHTLRLQGGPMAPAEAEAFAADPDFHLFVALRRWDEGAKVPGAVVPGWGAYRSDIEALLAAHLFKPFAAQMPGGPLSLGSVLPPNASDALGPGGPGFVVIRGWLSAAEVACLQQYAREFVPGLPDAAVHHTYERRSGGVRGTATTVDGAPHSSGGGSGTEGDPDVAPSRTEFFAHVADPAGVGARLLSAATPEGATSRLAELCAVLRAGKPQALYKEKVNYKLAGGTGGYLPHQDYYHGFHSETGARTELLPDSAVCVCMLAVDDIDPGNGCPEVAPGWHNRGPLAFSSGGSPALAGFAVAAQALTAVEDDGLPWTPVSLSPGDVLVYGNMMPHRSAPNTSTRDRRALFAVYVDEGLAGRNIREAYYAHEAAHRRAQGSQATQGKANQFFTGQPVLRRGN